MVSNFQSLYKSICFQLSRGQRMTMLARNSGSSDGILEKALRRKIGILTVKGNLFRSILALSECSASVILDQQMVKKQLINI